LEWIHSKDEHIEHVKKILEKITYRVRIKLQFKKCRFFQKEARILGTLVSGGEIKMDPKKVKAILEWPEPQDSKALQRFMGAVNFH
jgi:translation initiation factor IF-2